MKICKTVLLAVFFMGSATLWAEDRPVPSDPADPLWKSIPEVVATVKGKPITRQDFIKTFTESLPDGKLPPEATAETVAQVAPGLVKFQVARILLEPKFAESGIKPSVERSRDISRKELDSLSPNARKALAPRTGRCSHSVSSSGPPAPSQSAGSESAGPCGVCRRNYAASAVATMSPAAGGASRRASSA